MECQALSLRYGALMNQVFQLWLCLITPHHRKEGKAAVESKEGLNSRALVEHLNEQPEVVTEGCLLGTDPPGRSPVSHGLRWPQLSAATGRHAP